MGTVIFAACCVLVNWWDREGWQLPCAGGCSGCGAGAGGLRGPGTAGGGRWLHSAEEPLLPCRTCRGTRPFWPSRPSGSWCCRGTSACTSSNGEQAPPRPLLRHGAPGTPGCWRDAGAGILLAGVLGCSQPWRLPWALAGCWVEAVEPPGVAVRGFAPGFCPAHWPAGATGHLQAASHVCVLVLVLVLAGTR